MIKCIIFDIGGVFQPNTDRLVDETAAKNLGISSDQYSDFRKEMFSQVTKGQISLTDFFYAIIERLGLEVKGSDVTEAYSKTYRETTMTIDPEVVNLANSLRKKYKIVALTNSEREIIEINKTWEIYDNFEKVYTSVDLGFSKPDPEIYLAVLDDLGLKAEECVFVDDKLVNAKGAAKVGLHAIHFKDAKRLAEELNKLGV